MRGWRLILVAQMILWASVAHAAEGVLIAKDGKVVLVWKTRKAMDEGLTLLRAKADPQLIVPLISCAPESGTRVIKLTSDSGLFTRDVLVIEGKWKGGRGVIPYEYFKQTK